jgi:hypothetical protein
MNKLCVWLCLTVAVFYFGCVSNTNAQTYTSDPRIGDFTSQVSSYGTLSNFNSGSFPGPTFTPTSAELASDGFYFWNGGPLTGLPGSNWLLVSFSGPVSSILVFPSIDHPDLAYDGYQYSIVGSNDKLNWTPLFNAMSVGGTVPPFTLSGFTGTAPTIVNNVLNGGCTIVIAPVIGCVGYEALFNFGTAYRYYAFGSSTEAIRGANVDQELSAVGATTPEPSSMVLIGSGLWLIAWRRKRFLGHR